MKPIYWKIKAGGFTTNQQCEINLKLPAFYEHKVVTWQANVDPSKQSTSQYDLIIGRDMIINLGIDIFFSQECIKWGEAIEVAMKHPSFLYEPQWVDLLKKELMYI